MSLAQGLTDEVPSRIPALPTGLMAVEASTDGDLPNKDWQFPVVIVKNQHGKNP